MGRGNYCPSGEATNQWHIDHDSYLRNDDEHEKFDYE